MKPGQTQKLLYIKTKRAELDETGRSFPEGACVPPTDLIVRYFAGYFQVKLLSALSNFRSIVATRGHFPDLC